MAIDSKDLRISNLVDIINESGYISPDTGYNWMVVAILENGVNVRPFNEPSDPKEFIPYERLSPITLIEDWLKRCGFVFGNNTGYWVYLNDNNKSDYVEGNVFYLWVPADHQIYLHQLQNSFYIDTNKELNIKEVI